MASRLFLRKEIWWKQASSKISPMIKVKKLVASKITTNAKTVSVMSHSVSGLERVHRKNLSSTSTLSPTKKHWQHNLLIH